MLPIIAGVHAAYQDTFVSDFLTFYPDSFSISKTSWDVIIHFWYLDLSLTDLLMAECYSKLGPAPRLPSCMLRSYLLSIKFKITSITRWVALQKENLLFAILSGFQFGDTPGVGTFMTSFLACGMRIPIISPKKRHPKHKVKKGKYKGQKTPVDAQAISSRLLPFFQSQ